SGNFTGEGDYGWFYENSWKYGFVRRYDENKQDITGIGYEPWHFRYVGKDNAKYMYEHKLCLEEYVNN
ncbi:MAG: D-alanyl-D-alanine carboxypeptidase family protein, partial [Ruminococcus sp.]|nr:D-alanyl-D-alanine carboxypeptidase family protein [Ruminococcus sp.]